MDKFTDVEDLTHFITDEFFKLFKASPQSWARKTFGSLFRLPTHRFAMVACRFDHYVEQYGFHEAAMRIMPVFAQEFEARNIDNIPRQGPLLVTSNHPGTCDSLVIAASIPRPDLKIVASGLPFLKGLKNTANYLIYTSKDMYEQMMVVRVIIRYLKQGGAVLIFPSGRIEPDPAHAIEASSELEKWSPSLEVILRHVPQTQVLLSVVSGVLSERWRNNPFVHLFRDDHKQRSVAEFLQVIQQMIFPNSLCVTPRLTFSDPLTTSDLAQSEQGMLDGLIKRTRRLMIDHMAQGEHILPVNT